MATDTEKDARPSEATERPQVPQAVSEAHTSAAAQDAPPAARPGGTTRFVPTWDAIADAQDILVEDVPVPEWGAGAVIPIRTITAAERDAYEATITETKGGTQQLRIRNARAKLVVLAAIRTDIPAPHPRRAEAGELNPSRRCFSEDHIGMLGDKSAAALGRMFDKARSMAGMTNEDLAELEDQLGKGQSA